MYEYEIYNKETNEHNFVWGYSVDDVKRNCTKIDWSKWSIIRCEYID